MNPNIHLESKTSGALILLLIVVVGLSLLDKLTPEAVDAIKWLGGSFFGVRGITNLAEGLVKKNG